MFFKFYITNSPPTKGVVGIYGTQMGQMSMISKPYRIGGLISQDIGTVDRAYDWLIWEFGYANAELDDEFYLEEIKLGIVEEDNLR